MKFDFKSLPSQKIFSGEIRKMVNEDDGREDPCCTAGNMSAFAGYFFLVQAMNKPTVYSHGR